MNRMSVAVGTRVGQLALTQGRAWPRVVDVDGHPAYASAVAELKQTRELGHVAVHVRLPPVVSARTTYGDPDIHRLTCSERLSASC